MLRRMKVEEWTFRHELVAFLSPTPLSIPFVIQWNLHHRSVSFRGSDRPDLLEASLSSHSPRAPEHAV